jgi:paraquat-inducible protein A
MIFGSSTLKMPSLIVCPACDLVHRGAVMSAGERTRCVRCRAVLHRPPQAELDSAIAIALSALVLFVLANFYPLVEFDINGAKRATTLIGAALGLYHAHHSALSLLVLATTVLAPLAQILGLLYLLLPLRRKRRARHQRAVFRLLMHLRPWTFVEVFMLGAIVALVRLSSYAKVVPGIALLCCGLLMISLAALTSRTSPQQFWHWVERSRE